MDSQEAKDVEEAIKHLEDILYVLRSNYKYRTSYAIELLINGYRTLEKQVEELKNLANNTQWISPCYVAENYIAKEKVDEKIEKLNKNELLCKMNFENIKFTIEVLQELKEG